MIVEVKADIFGQVCWYWEIEFADKFGCSRKLQSPVRFNPGIQPDIRAALEQFADDLQVPLHYTLTPPRYTIA